MYRFLGFFLFLLIWSSANSQQVTYVEYFLDSDPGLGNATSISIESGLEISSTFEIPTDNLTSGIHRLFIRGRNEQGEWGFSLSRLFYLITSESSTEVEYLEYFLDTDPGLGDATPVIVQPGSEASATFEIPTDNLSTGIHRLYLRGRNDLGQWGFSESRLFYLSEPLGFEIQGLEYFIDNDPGAGLATPISFAAGTEASVNLEIPTDGLNDGQHTFNLRGKDQFGKWYILEFRTFAINPFCGMETIPEWAQEAVEYLCSNGVYTGVQWVPNMADSVISRAQLATLVFNAIGLREGNDLASDFPSPYGDLQDRETWYHKAAKNLLYLEYKDGRTPFDRNRFNFQPDSSITKAHATKVMVEAWNLALSEGSLSYADVEQSHEVYSHLVTAEENLAFENAPFEDAFEPNIPITWAEASLFLYNLIQNQQQPEITPEDFFIPGNITPLTLSSAPSISEGYFDYSGGTSFAISGIGIPLVFSHGYNSFYHELPAQLNTGVNNSQTPLKPLGSGWSHSFNAYMLQLESVEDEEKWAVVWPDGAFHFYDQTEVGYEAQTLGVYDTLIRVSESKFQVTSKAHMSYVFEKIPGSLDAFPFVLTQITDRNKNTISITYSLSENNGWYRIKDVTGTAGRKLKFSYLAGSDLISTITDPAGRRVHFEYDSKNNARANLIEYTDVKGNKEQYEYIDLNGFKFLSKITFPDGNEITNTYDDLLRKLKTSKNKYAESSLVFTYHFGYSETEGSFTYSTFTDENDLEFRVDRNTAGRLQQFKQPTGLVTLDYEDGSLILPSKITGIDKVPSLPKYDQKGNVTKITLPDQIEHTFSYEENDLTNYTDPLGNVTRYTYDDNRNLVSIETAEGGVTQFERLKNGLLKSVTSPEGITIQFEYDKYGNLTKTEAPEGIETSAVFDILGRVQKQFNNAGQEYLFEYDLYNNLKVTTDPLGYKTRYQYDQATNDLDAIVNAKNKATNLEYDDKQRLIKEEFEGNTTKYAFDDTGYLDSYQDASGHTFAMAYDDERRLIGNGYSTLTYDKKDNIETVTGLDGKVIEYKYSENLNRLEAISYDGETVGYSYDKAGNLTTLTYPGDKTVGYEYDREHRLTKVTDWVGNVTTYTYLKDGRLATMTYPNQVKNTYKYDEAGRSIGFTSERSDDTPFYSYAYILDPTGRHIQEDYDGEIDQQFQQEEASISYQYNSANRIQKAGEVTFDFDGNGNTIRKGNTTFSYDLWNNLTHLKSPDEEISYTYDGLGNRRSRTENGQTTKYTLDILGMSRVLIENLQEDKKNFYVYGLGLISRIDQDENSRHYHYDFRGSTIAITDENESVTHSYIYDVFGETLSATEADYNPFRFVGKHGVMYEEDDFYFMRARYYDASIGRFLSEDPIWSANLYVYGGNDPVNLIDPSGKYAETSIDVSLLALSIDAYDDDPSFINGAAIAVDVAFIAAPGFTGGSIVLRKGYALAGDFGSFIYRTFNKAPPPRSTILVPSGLGTTGRTAARNLPEKLAMEEIMKDPASGKILIENMKDSTGRWNGWSKMSNKNAHGIEIHYNALWENGIIKAVDDFKFISN